MDRVVPVHNNTIFSYSAKWLIFINGRAAEDLTERESRALSVKFNGLDASWYLFLPLGPQGSEPDLDFQDESYCQSCGPSRTCNKEKTRVPCQVSVIPPATYRALS